MKRGASGAFFVKNSTKFFVVCVTKNSTMFFVPNIARTALPGEFRAVVQLETKTAKTHQTFVFHQTGLIEYFH